MLHCLKLQLEVDVCLFAALATHTENKMRPTYDHSGPFIVNASRTRPVHSGRTKCKIRTRLRVLTRAVAVGAYVARLRTDLVDSVHHDMVGVSLAGAVNIGHIGVEAHDGRGILGCIEWKQAEISAAGIREQ